MAPTVLLTLLWAVVGGATICYVNWLYRGHARELAENLTTIQASDAMQDVLWRLQASVLEVAEVADGHTRLEVAEWETAFETHLAEAERTTVTSEERSLVGTIRAQFSQYRTCIHRRLDPEAAAPESERPSTLETARLAHEVAASCQRLLEVNKRLIARSIAQRSQLRAVFNLALLSLFLVGPAVGILYGMGIARRLHRSMAQISIHLQDAADGLEHEVGRVELRPSNDLPELQEQVQLVSARIRQVVEELRQARREALAADRLSAVGELAAGVAHELRNPLTGVKLLIQAAAKRPADRPLSAQELSVVQEQIIRMEKTIQGLLDYARPPEMHQVRHDLRDTVRRALNLVAGHARQMNIAVCEDFSLVPVLVDGDPGQLHQVFVNLLLNGIEAMPGGGELWVAVQDAALTDGCCRVTVTDSGNGISENILERMFEPFVTSKERGTGLGLAISRRIVQQHGGKLTAANREERGAVFSVKLPRCSEPPPPAAGCQGEVTSDRQAASDPTSYDRWEAHDAQTAHH